MPKYWVVAPFKYEGYDPEQWNSVWDFDKRESVISFGWNDLKDYSSLTAEQLREEIVRHWPDYTPGKATQTGNMLWSFCHEIQVGDFIVARKGRKVIADIGQVTRTYFHSASMNKDASPGDPHSNYLGVMWKGMEPKIFNRIVFGMQTLYEVSADLFKGWMSEGQDEVTLPAMNVLSATGLVPESAAEFVLEKYLEEFIISNFDTIFQKKLAIHKEDDVLGQQYGTDVGIIDILARDAVSGDYVVIELKKGFESDKVIGQILRYMGWVAENLCKDGQKVRGLVICQDTDIRFSYALTQTPNISAKYYKVKFELRDKGN